MIAVYAECDRAGCFERVKLSRERDNSSTLRDAPAKMVTIDTDWLNLPGGWTVKGSREFCPAHSGEAA